MEAMAALRAMDSVSPNTRVAQADCMPSNAAKAPSRKARAPPFLCSGLNHSQRTLLPRPQARYKPW